MHVPRFSCKPSRRLLSSLTMATLMVLVLMTGTGSARTGNESELAASADNAPSVPDASIDGRTGSEIASETGKVVGTVSGAAGSEDEAGSWQMRGRDDGARGNEDDDETLGEPVRLRGVIDSLPAGGGAVGDWVISGRTVRVTDSTELELSAQQMVKNTPVTVKGNLGGSGIIYARQIDYEEAPEDEDERGEISFRGIVQQTPDNPTGEGEWLIRSGHNRQRTVLADAGTERSLPLPQVGQWVEIEGQPLAGDVIRAAQIRLDDAEESEIVVRLQDGIGVGAVASRYGLIYRRTLLKSGNIHLFAAADDGAVAGLIDQLQGDDQVIWAERNYVGGIPEANPYQTWAWGGVEASGYVSQVAFEQIHLAPAQTRYKGDNMVIAVLDTGVSVDHPTLQEHLLPGVDLVDDDTDPDEENGGVAWGHGTHVSGIVAHIAPNSKILPVRVLDANGRGDSFLVAHGIEWAVAQGADVINLSLGTPYDSQVLRQAVEQATRAGVVVVAAAGNEGVNDEQYPAAYADTVAVTAVDALNGKAGFANYGAWIDLAAPGVGITSTIVGPVTLDAPDGNGFASWSGTSMATAFASGVAALARQKMPAASPADLETLLVDSAVDINTINVDFSNLIGKLLNADAALSPLVMDRFIYLPGIISQQP